jgi:hypothetical protein
VASPTLEHLKNNPLCACESLTLAMVANQFLDPIEAELSMETA